jgi:hypothetical protein
MIARANLQRRVFLKTSLAGVSGLLLTRPVVRAAQSAVIPTIGDAAQLFVDGDYVEQLDNVTRVFHAAEKHSANPVLRKEKPWETLRGTWGTVLYDDEEGLFKAWYGGQGRSTGINKPGFQRRRHVLCYATSPDGVAWQRPELGMHEVTGTNRNNVVVGDEHHLGMDHWESVLKDPIDSDPERRYKAIGWSSNDWDGPMSGIYTMTSPDGLRWTHTREPVFHFHPRSGTDDLGPVGDAQAMMIDTLRGRYVAFLRRLPHRAMSESNDFIHWTPPTICLRARSDEKVNTIYNHKGFVYGDRYLGFLTYFQRDLVNPLCTVRLLTSRDGESWQRPTDAPLIDVGDVGSHDRFLNMLTGGPPIRVGNQLHIYYRALANRHGPYEGRDDPQGEYPGGISLATIRVDGFASLDASYDGGRVTTRPFRFTGSKLHVNAKADFGKLLVEVLDRDGKPLPGFTQRECRPVRSDRIDQPIAWQENAELGSLKNRPIRLRFVLKNARLFSYRIA